MKDLNFRRMCRLINAFGKVRRGTLQEKNLNKNTLEAGIYMKTNKSRTKCPEKIGHLCLRFGHFCLTDTNFAEIRGEFTVKRRQYRVCGRRRRLGRSERENAVRNVETPAPRRVAARESGDESPHSKRSLRMPETTTGGADIALYVCVPGFSGREAAGDAYIRTNVCATRE
jgi:hypothetical protein